MKLTDETVEQIKRMLPAEQPAKTEYDKGMNFMLFLVKDILDEARGR